MKQSTIDALIGSIYAAVTAASGFQQFIAEFSAAAGASGVLLIMRHVVSQELQGVWVVGMDPAYLQSYALRYAGEDVLALHMEHSPIGRFYASNLDVPERAHYHELPFYRDWVQPQGMAYAAGCVILREGQWLTQIFLQRSTAQPPFSRRTMVQLERLVPHLQRALQMRQRFAELRLGRDMLAGSLDVLAMPALLCDERGRMAHCNRSGRALLEAGGGLWLDGGLLRARSEPVARQLALALCGAVRASHGDGSPEPGVVLLPRAGAAPLSLLVTPLQMGEGSALPGAALVLAYDPLSTPVVQADLLRQLFGLSAAEAALASALCGGKTLEEAAGERGTAISTARSQLKSIFNKTGTRRQADLVSLLLTSPAYFLAQRGQE
ncbi:helix-turn-helix transcriptional regulator [Pseudoduganella aquatica]|nr:hypothetical protein [Pseudoduganella aquatica]